jgi:hypothetical protein
MGIFGARRVNCPAGRWTTIISNFGSGMPKTFRVALTPDEGEEVFGEYEERKYTWIFPCKTSRGQLKPMMRFDREWINAIYKVRIRPDRNVIAEFL